MKFLRRIASGVMPSFRAAASTRPLDDISRLGPSGAAIGIDRHGVGEDGADAAMERLDVVEARAACRRRHAECRARRSRDRRPCRPSGRHPCRRTCRLRPAPSSRCDVVAALRVAHEVIGAIGGPFDGLAQLFAPRPRSARIRDTGNSLVPNPPPTSGQITRIFSSGIFRIMPPMISRRRWLPWLPIVSVR